MDAAQVDDKFCVWQFNFRDFNLQDDLYAQDSIELLKQSGIDFQLLQRDGIDPVLFGELLMSSGIVLNDEVRVLIAHHTHTHTHTHRNVPTQQQQQHME